MDDGCYFLFNAQVGVPSRSNQVTIYGSYRLKETLGAKQKIGT